jgi:hypothetical protein
MAVAVLFSSSFLWRETLRPEIFRDKMQQVWANDEKRIDEGR